MRADRIIPLIIAVALFMEHMDSTVIATSLPAIAADIGTNPLALKLAITTYLLSLAIFIPASGWTADRFGARTVFRAAIAVFVIGSIGCALSSSLTDFVIARVVQGMGGAMMTPVGRMVVIRSIPKRELVNAMAWVATPALIGPMLGPPVGGFITTYATWHWIFIINVPIGLLGILLATRYIPELRSEQHERFDVTGMVLAGLGIGGVAFGFSVLGLNYLPWFVVAAMIAGGALFVAAYLVHARRVENPALDLTLFKLPTLPPAYRRLRLPARHRRAAVSVAADAADRLRHDAVSVGAHHLRRRLRRHGHEVGGDHHPALVRLPHHPGDQFADQRGLPRGLRQLHHRDAGHRHAGVLLFAGGFFRSLQFTCTNTIAYAEVENARVGRATSLASVAQQLAISSGVAVGAMAVELTQHFKGGGALTAADFRPAFLVVAAISACSILFFLRLSRMPAPKWPIGRLIRPNSASQEAG